MNEVRSATIELREAAESPGRIVGTLIETGRVAVDQKEVFVPGSIMFPSNGVELLASTEAGASSGSCRRSTGAASGSMRRCRTTPLGAKWPRKSAVVAKKD